MARTVKEANLASRKARARLKRGRQAHWRTLIPGRAHLGYQRWPDDAEGRWILRRLSDGKYAVTPLGLADDAREADGVDILAFEQAEAMARALLDRPEAAPIRLTVRQAMDRYIEFKRSQAQPVADLVWRSRAHVIPTLGDNVVAELSAQELRRWLATLAAMPVMKRTKRGAAQRYGAEPADAEAVRRRRSSANRVLNYLRAALNHAFDESLVPRNDAWGRKLKPFRSVEVARIRYLSVEEARRLVNAADPDFRALVQAALATGARYSELIRLEVQDFNSDAGTIAIRRSKSGQPRHIVLTDEGVRLFLHICVGRTGDELMFSRGPSRREWRPHEQGRYMREACAHAKIVPPVGFHALRHTVASHAIMAGVPLMVVAKNLGHATTAMCERH